MFAGTTASAPEATAGEQASAVRTQGSERVLRDLERQIARLEAHYQALLASAFPRTALFALKPSGSPAAQSQPRLPDLNALERCRDELAARVLRLERALAAAHAREAEMRRKREALFRDPRAHAGLVVSNRDCGEPGCTTYRAVPRLGLLGLVFGWWRVKVSSGCPLARSWRRRLARGLWPRVPAATATASEPQATQGG